jgi:hypothetical protein
MNDTTYFIYEHINLINGKRYIGLTKQNPPSKRWENGRGYIKNTVFFNDILFYGWKTGFEHNILYEGLTQEEAFNKEIELIERYNTTNPDFGYNISKGGALGPGDFTKSIQWQREHKKFGEDNINSRKVQCKETGDIFGSVSEANRWSRTTKVGDCCRGLRDHAGTHPETNQPLTWQYVSKDSKVTQYCHQERNDKKHIKRIKCIDTNEVFNSAAEAGRVYNITPCNILRVCQGKRKTAGKLKWCYYIEEKEE